MKTLQAFTLATILATCGNAIAAPHEHGTAQKQVATPAENQTYAGTGILKEIESGRIKIAHDPIPALHWPAMTMWFLLHSPLSSDMKVGNKVQFELAQTASGKWVITRIEREY